MMIFDVRITDSTFPGNHSRSTDQALGTGGGVEKQKYLQACLEAQQNFTPLVFIIKGCMEGYPSGNQAVGRTLEKEM